MAYISGSSASLLRMLEEAFEAGFSAGYYCEDNPSSYEEEWEEYKQRLEEYFHNLTRDEPHTQEEISARDTYEKHP